MWIKELPNNFKDKASYAFDALFLWKNDVLPVYVMDNHLSAAWCWMQECDPKECYNFMHIDRHSDLKGCGFIKDIRFLQQTPHISFDEYLNLSYETHERFQFFQWDNYIRACQSIFPQWFNSNLFYTLDDNSCDANDWGYSKICIQSCEPCNVINDIDCLVQKKLISKIRPKVTKKCSTFKWIVNVDLDFFWDSDGNKLYDDSYIRKFALCLNNSMNNIKVLTIALSPDCIPGSHLKEKWNNVIHVLDILKIDLRCLSESDLNIK